MAISPIITTMEERMDLIQHLKKQIEFSSNAFGPGDRLHGILDHIKKEIEEIKNQPKDLEEWIDLVMLSLDGAWRAGFSPAEIAEKLAYKLEKNIKRQWPDWRKADPNKAIEHIRAEELEKTKHLWRCDRCGEEFKIEAKELQGDKKHYCSETCKYQAEWLEMNPDAKLNHQGFA